MNFNPETKVFLGIALGTLLLVGLAAVFWGRGTPAQPAVLASAQVLVAENSHSVGPSDAKVTIVEFSDFQCPACKAAEPALERVLEEYKDKIRFVYRHYPLPSHEFGMIAAQAAESAGLQGKFWEMHKLLFGLSPNLAKDKLLAQAQSLNLDMDKFNQDFDSGVVKTRVTKDQDDGNAVGIDATPTFFINGTKFVGVLSLSQLETEINSRLK